jgi:hypothetical protein
VPNRTYAEPPKSIIVSLVRKIETASLGLVELVNDPKYLPEEKKGQKVVVRSHFLRLLRLGYHANSKQRHCKQD